jgi:hypothetical protein
MNGIATFHDGFNYGAFLQVYALQNYLLEAGINNEIINYKNRKHWLNEYKCFLVTKDPQRLVSNIVKMSKFRKDQKKFKQTRFSSKPGAFSNNDYDTVFFGSDEIWNFRLPLFGEDRFYFGEGIPAKQRVAYAASFGNLNAGTLMPEKIRTLLAGFKAISVRDENSALMLKKNIGIDAQIVLDPTLLYDFSGHEEECFFDDFIMVYSAAQFDQSTQKKIREYADLRGKRLISVGYQHKFCDVSKIGIGPFEFLGYYKKADVVITSMFHGTLFSIKYKKNFCVVTDAYRVNKMSLLMVLGLQARIYGNGRSFSDILGTEIDYKSVDNILALRKEESRDFILNSVKV